MHRKYLIGLVVAVILGIVGYGIYFNSTFLQGGLPLDLRLFEQNRDRFAEMANHIGIYQERGHFNLEDRETGEKISLEMAYSVAKLDEIASIDRAALSEVAKSRVALVERRLAKGEWVAFGRELPDAQGKVNVQVYIGPDVKTPFVIDDAGNQERAVSPTIGGQVRDGWLAIPTTNELTQYTAFRVATSIAESGNPTGFAVNLMTNNLSLFALMTSDKSAKAALDCTAAVISAAAFIASATPTPVGVASRVALAVSGLSAVNSIASCVSAGRAISNNFSVGNQSAIAFSAFTPGDFNIGGLDFSNIGGGALQAGSNTPMGFGGVSIGIPVGGFNFGNIGSSINIGSGFSGGNLGGLGTSSSSWYSCGNACIGISVGR